jgi:hypothetical protein
MKSFSSKHRIAAYALAALALLFLVAQPALGLGLLFALLIPVWFFVALALSPAIPVPDEFCTVFPFPVLSVLSPRPPPIL